MNILLLGFPRSGKTTIGKLLKKKLKKTSFIELDKVILERTGSSTVQEVYHKRMSLWKEKELEVNKELSQNDNLIIATSGAIVENDLNLQYYRENSTEAHFIYLHATLETISARLTASLDSDTAEKILESLTTIYPTRDFLYRSIATIEASTDQEKKPEKLVEEIENKINSY